MKHGCDGYCIHYTADLSMVSEEEREGSDSYRPIKGIEHLNVCVARIPPTCPLFASISLCHTPASATPVHKIMPELLRRSKWVRLRAWMLRVFRPSAAHIHDFVMNNPTFYNIQIAPDQVASAMKALSKRAIDGAEYDSAVRDPPPSCHPGTRVQLLKKIKTWFYNKKRGKSLLWLSGPAGVGKSAVIQTFAESLAEAGSLGAALFFSRLNDRNDPQRVIATISFQLATRIPAYRTYVAHKITLDPSLLRKGMKDQFQALIVEPFGDHGIGQQGGPWGILLDGLDECEGADQQREIVCLVGEFVLKFPNAPLVWSISSRPEPHIVTTFASSTIVPSHWSEYVPINSTEGCQDVERYLNENFERMRSEFPHVPRSWPKETQFLKLANGASGLFVFARTAIRFMEDPDHADPVSRLKLLLSVIEHLDLAVTDEHPFALLDAVYNHILMSIPPTLWPTTKRVLGFFICVWSPEDYTRDGLSYPLESRSISAASFILDIEHHIVHSSLHKLHSVLEIPHPNLSSSFGVSFLHASFGDYLTDPIRSLGFFIDRGNSVDDITRCLVRIDMMEPAESASHASKLLKVGGQSFRNKLEKDARAGLFHGTTGDLRSDRGRGPFILEEDRSQCLNRLEKIDVGRLSWSEYGHHFIPWLFRLWDMFQNDLISRGLVKEVPLREVEVGHLSQGFIRAVFSNLSRNGEKVDSAVVALRDFKVDFQQLQEGDPDMGVLICGTTPQKRNAFIRCDKIKYLDSYGQGYYCIAYP